MALFCYIRIHAPGLTLKQSPVKRIQWGQEQRNECEVTFDAEHKKVAASDMKLATTWYECS